MQSQMKGNSSQTTADEVTDEEEVLVYVHFDDFTEVHSDEDLANCKILGVDTQEPILQIGSKVFGGTWKETVGTAVFFEESELKPKKCYFSVNVPKPLKYTAKTQKMLFMNRVFVTAKEPHSPNTTSNLKVVQHEDEQMQTE